MVFHTVPILTVVGPWYLMFQQIGLYNTLTALVLTHVAHQPADDGLADDGLHPRRAPRARGGGARRRRRPGQAFRRVVLPLIVPGLIAAGVLAFVF